MIEENSLYMKDRYIVEWDCGNRCRNMTFENIEDAIEFADEIGGKITINRNDNPW